jgi:CRISPR type III-B/RAMP module RAMP protein Cmr6
MLAVTKPVAAAVAKRCDAWHLRLDKFSFEQRGGPEAKTEALRTVRDCYRQVAVIHVEPAVRRTLTWLDRLQHQLGKERFDCVELTLESRLLLHLGRANVLENVGLYAERTTGLPLIPGTALKGVISTWACWAANEPMLYEEKPQLETTRVALARRILGDNNTTGSEHAGEVIFLGGFPLCAPMLGLDIVNPHYEANGDDKRNLTPNAFLCVEPDTIWRFAFFVRSGVPDAAVLLSQTKTWIEEALTQTGIGAKTAAGYGRFRKPNADDLAAQQRQAAENAAAQAAAAAKAQIEAEKAKQHSAVQAAMKSDYPNPATFKNRVLDKLTPGSLDQLRSQVPLLQKPENEAHREELQKLLTTREFRDIRKRLREKDWFPNDWLPPQ